jgi:hypothetical protein
MNITQEQFKSIEHFKSMFEYASENVMGLAKNSEIGEIELGFELGRIYTDLRQFAMEMSLLLYEIKEQ